MVEEMYAEEMRDMEGCIEETDRSGQGERENNGGGGDGGSNMIEDVPNNNKSSLRTTFLTEPKSEALQDTNDIAAEHASEIVLRTDASKQAPESFIFHEKQSMGVHGKDGGRPNNDQGHIPTNDWNSMNLRAL